MNNALRYANGDIVVITDADSEWTSPSELYNVVRLAESKVHSTPVFHGELAAFRRALLEEFRGFPTGIGADDSHTATRVALMGCRSITVDNAWCVEKVPP